MYVCVFIQHGRKVSDFSLSDDKPRKNTPLARLSFIKINEKIHVSKKGTPYASFDTKSSNLGSCSISLTANVSRVDSFSI